MSSGRVARSGRDGGTGGFGSVLMKAWGNQWVYAPNHDGMGNTVGTRSLFVLETPSSSLTDPYPIGFKKKEARSVIIPGKIVADPKNVYNPDERQTRPSSLLLPSF